jgi:excisionase family DNA binding protein
MFEERIALLNAQTARAESSVPLPVPVDKKTYTVMEIQEVLGISRPTVYNLLKKREFRWIQVGGGKYRISKKSFDEWLDTQV